MTDERGQSIKEAGPATPVQVTGFDDVPNAGDSIVFGDGAVWVSQPGFPIARIHPATAKVVQQFTGDGAGDLYTGLGSLWLANPVKKTLTRFDPKRIVATLAE